MILIGISIVGYLLFAFAFHDASHGTFPIASVVPIALVAHRTGALGGVLASLVATLVNLLLTVLLDAWWDTPSFVMGHAALGMVAAVIGAMSDLQHRLRTEIAERARTEAERLEAQRARLKAENEARMLRANRLSALGTMAAGIAHEINNPLTHLLINVHEIEEGVRRLLSGASVDGHDLIEEIELQTRGLDRIRHIVRDLGVLTPREDVVEPDVDLREVVFAALKVTSHALRQATVELDLEEVPPVCASSDRLVQVVINLLINAGHALEDAGGQGQILLSTGLDSGGGAFLSIEDTGTGIPEADLPLIFDPFFTTKDVGVGTGLGLHVSRVIVEQFGGRIDVGSRVGVGTRVRIVLPASASRPWERLPERPSVGD